MARGNIDETGRGNYGWSNISGFSLTDLVIESHWKILLFQCAGIRLGVSFSQNDLFVFFSLLGKKNRKYHGWESMCLAYRSTESQGVTKAEAWSWNPDYWFSPGFLIQLRNSCPRMALMLLGLYAHISHCSCLFLTYLDKLLPQRNSGQEKFSLL